VNSNRLESISVREIGRIVDKFELMRHFLDTNDKTPIWDGEIWLYSNKKQSNDYFKGKVPVQIKGASVDKFSLKSRKYKLVKSHLKAYLKDNGIIFFVVEILDSDRVKVFFKTLLPIDIEAILKDMGENNSKLEKFYELKEQELEVLCRNFIKDSGKQNYKNIQLDKSKINFKSYSTTIIGNEKIDFDQYMFNHGLYLYGKIQDYGIEIPIKKLIIDTKYEQVAVNIGTKTKIYYDYLIIKKTRMKQTYHLGIVSNL